MNDILEASLEAFPASTFIQSLARQYAERGGLSKKQLEGLYKKSARIIGLPESKRATLEAVILKRPTRYKSERPVVKPFFEKDPVVGAQIAAILAKYPQHKRVLLFQTKYDNNAELTLTEKTELEKFYKVLLKP